MISSYQYSILRFVRRRKTCTLQKLSRRFGQGASASLHEMRQYLKYKSPVPSDDGFADIRPDGTYSLSDRGLAALAEYRYTLQLKAWEAILVAVFSAALGAFCSYLVTLLP